MYSGGGVDQGPEMSEFGGGGGGVFFIWPRGNGGNSGFFVFCQGSRGSEHYVGTRHGSIREGQDLKWGEEKEGKTGRVPKIVEEKNSKNQN